MTTSKELFLAILSMDAYNRGYGAGIGYAGADDGLGDAIGTRIGNAEITYRASSDPNEDAVAAGFYALAYQWNGETVIAYRGTDNADWSTLEDGASDLWQGWVGGAGLPGSQSSLALEFFRSVTGSNALEGEAGDVILTGHSLGGGLAGLVAAAQAWA
jgi:hypothetical protein